MPIGSFRLLRLVENLLLLLVALFVLSLILLIIVRIYAHILVFLQFRKARLPSREFYVRASPGFTLKSSEPGADDLNPYAPPQNGRETPDRYLESRTRETLALGFTLLGDYQEIVVIKEKDSNTWKQVPGPSSIARSFLGRCGTMVLSIGAWTVGKKVTSLRTEFSDGRSLISILPSSTIPLFDLSGLSDIAIAPNDGIEDLIEFHQNLVKDYPSPVIDRKETDFVENINQRMRRAVAALEAKGMVKFESDMNSLRFTFLGANLMVRSYLRATVAMRNANHASQQLGQPNTVTYDPGFYRRFLLLGTAFLSSYMVLENYIVLLFGAALFTLGVIGHVIGPSGGETDRSGRPE